MNLRIKVGLLLVLFFVGASSVVSNSLAASKSGQEDYVPIETTLDQFQDYKNWFKVNPKPIRMDFITAGACGPGNFNPRHDPHFNKYLTVFVNEIGKDAMLTKGKPAFPQGSIIVKEKLSKPDDEAPELLTAMVKRKPGYNPDNGDWEYVALDGKASEIKDQGHLENCQSCHAAQSENDFVFRNYRPKETKK